MATADPVPAGKVTQCGGRWYIVPSEQGERPRPKAKMFSKDVPTLRPDSLEVAGDTADHEDSAAYSYPPNSIHQYNDADDFVLIDVPDDDFVLVPHPAPDPTPLFKMAKATNPGTVPKVHVKATCVKNGRDSELTGSPIFPIASGP
jgi:hypothetical protein